MRIQYMRVCLQTRLSKITKMLVETNILQLGTLTENYNRLSIIIKREIILPLNQKSTDFCQIEPGIHTSTIPCS